MEFTEQELQAYRALYKWADRLNKWEYSKQVRKNKGKKLKTFSPNTFSLMIIEKQNELSQGKITAEEALSIIHTVEGRTETRLCMDAGF